MPGATATGKLAHRPMMAVAKTVARMVEAMAASWGMPASASMCGLTKIM